MPGKWARHRGPEWTAEELAIVAANPRLPTRELKLLLPGRSPQSIGLIRRRSGRLGGIPEEHPPVKDAGDYVEVLSHYMTDDFELMEIWLYWNGYATWRELSRDRRGWVTMVCTAK